jgi:hypothetical protein
LCLIEKNKCFKNHKKYLKERQECRQKHKKIKILKKKEKKIAKNLAALPVDVSDFFDSVSEVGSSNLADAFLLGAGDVTRSDVSEIEDLWLKMDLGCWLEPASRISCGMPESDGRRA